MQQFAIKLIKDIYINEIKESKMKKDGSCFKENSGTRLPNGDRLTASEIADLTKIRKIEAKKVRRSVQQHHAR